MSEKVTLIISAQPNKENMADIQGYSEKATPLFMQGGGEVIGRFENQGMVIGEKAAPVTVLVNFESEEAARGVFETPEYKELIPMRDRAFAMLNVFIAKNTMG